MALRPFGCEFEFSSDWDAAEAAIRKAVAAVYGPNKITVRLKWYRSRRNRGWHMKDDSSTVGEFATPISRGDDLRKVCSVVDRLHKSGVKAGDDDGFHVHVDARGVDPRHVVAAWSRIEGQILSAFPASRRKNDYCYPIFRGGSKFEDMMESAVDHHSSISMRFRTFPKAAPRMNKRGTVEFRIAEGTFDQVLVRHWVKFCVRFVDECAKGDPYALLLDNPREPTFKQVFRELGLLSSFKFFDARRSRFRRQRVVDGRRLGLSA